MKRLTIRFFALALACSLLTGCAPKKNVIIASESGIGGTVVESRTGKEDTAATEESILFSDALTETALPVQTEESATQKREEMTPERPVEIRGLDVAEVTLNDCDEDGLYGYPNGSDLVYSVNGVINGDIQLKSAPPDLLCFGCKLTLEFAETAVIEMRVYENGELRISGAYDVALVAGENSILAFIKLQNELSGDYLVELWYNNQPALNAVWHHYTA